MPPGKSSASSGTRKKNARKKAAKGAGSDDEGPAQPQHRKLQRGEKKNKKDKNAPKKKQYVPPPKPPRGAQDPVDLYGLGIAGASPLPQELVVTLRLLMKRAENTLARSLEDLDGWVRSAVGTEDGRQQVLLVVPVWGHHFPRLAVHGSRRIRLLTASLHSFLASDADIRPDLLAPSLLENAEYIGAWCASAFDADRAVRTTARRTWDSVIDLRAGAETLDDSKILLETYLEAILGYLREAILPGAGDEAPAVDESEEDATSRHSRLVAQSLDAVGCLIQNGTHFGHAPFDIIVGADELWTKLGPQSGELPIVRRSLWSLLAVLLQPAFLRPILDEMLPVISRSALHAVFAESDATVQSVAWPSLMTLLRAHPEAWRLADRKEEEEGSDSEDEEEANDTSEVKIEDANGEPSHSEADLPLIVVELLSFLQLGCRGNPTSAYPVIVLLLASMPNDLWSFDQTHLDAFFSSFWAAFDGRALEPHDLNGAATKAFVQSVLECTILLSNRANKAGHKPQTDLLAAHCERVWRELIGQGQLPASKIGSIRDACIDEIAKTLERAPDSADSISAALRRVTFELVDSDTDANGLGAVVVRFGTSSAVGKSFLQAVFERLVDAFARHKASVGRLRDVHAILADATGHEVALASAAMQRLDVTVSQLFIDDSPSPEMLQFLAFYMQNRGDSIVQQDIWQAMTTHISRSATPLKDPYLVALLEMQARGALPTDLPSAELDEAVLGRVREVVASGESATPAEVELLVDIVAAGPPFIAAKTVDSVLNTASAPLSGATYAWPLLRSLVGRPALLKRLVISSKSSPALVSAFEASQLGHGSAANENATAVWQLADASEHAMPLREAALQRLKGQVFAPDTSASSEALFDAMHELQLPREALFDAIFPDQQTTEQLLQDTPSATAAAELGILDPLVDSGSSSQSALQATASPYARAVLAGVRILSQDRSRAQQAAWLLPHILRLSVAAQDELAVEGSAAFVLGPVSQDEAEGIAAACDALAVYIIGFLVSSAGPGLTASVIAALRKPAEPTGDASLSAIFSSLVADKSSWSRRTLARLLSGAMRSSDAGTAEAEQWLGLAQSYQKTDPVLTLALLSAVVSYIYDSPRLNRYQNELASTLSGVSPAKAGTTGLELLRLLLVTAPPSDSNAEFIPQQRTMFLLQSLQKWFTSDEDIGDDVYARLAELFVHLAPVVQDREGGHWDFMFDVLESNVETASWSDGSSLPGLYHSLQLYAAIQELAGANAALRTSVAPRLKSSLSNIRKALLTPIAWKQHSKPVEMTLTLGLQLLQASTVRTLDMAQPFSALLNLLHHDDEYIRQSAFALASRGIEEHVKELVVEAELESESPPIIELPAPLVDLVRKDASKEEAGSAFLLAWLLVFEHLAHSSFRLKAAYLDQLRRHELVETVLLPRLFAILTVGERGFPFDPSPWSVETLDPLSLDRSTLGTSLLAAHVYMRALQSITSLVRAWWESQRNRQLSMAVASFTSKNFSPILIQRELSLVDQGKLADDDLVIKISVTGAEVRAIYTVDETPMELSMRLPPEYPLLGVVINDKREIGVAEKQWRAWILAVQQVIMTQNGLLADALALFKRNVALHFEGVEACAICYSVISVVDRSLPTKRCRTCKNLFHPACLYRWFSTSSGSTCPLCRAIF